MNRPRDRASAAGLLPRHGVKSIVRTFDGAVLEYSETCHEVRNAIDRGRQEGVPGAAA